LTKEDKESMVKAKGGKMGAKISNIKISFFFVSLEILILFLLLPAQAFSEETESVQISFSTGKKYLLNRDDSWYKFKLGYEKGFLGFISHTIQFGTNGTNFNYIEEGGQNVLFPFTRMTADLKMNKRHNLTFLIQPFEIYTSSLPERDIIVEDITFPEGRPLNLKYGFTFYRLSYLYDFQKESNKEFAIGLSFQIRNASIIFSSADGELISINNNIGPVPILKLRWQKPIGESAWIGSEIDGFYASGRYITGSENDFEGAIIDASLRFGFDLTDYLDTYLNIRYLGGGASGTEEDEAKYTDNWLKTFSVSLGFYLQ
jgi:hypothetical protein